MHMWGKAVTLQVRVSMCVCVCVCGLCSIWQLQEITGVLQEECVFLHCALCPYLSGEEEFQQTQTCSPL